MKLFKVPNLNMLFLKLQTLNICGVLECLFVFSKIRCEPSVRLEIAYEESRRVAKDQNSLLFPFKKKSKLANAAAFCN